MKKEFNDWGQFEVTLIEDDAAPDSMEVFGPKFKEITGMKICDFRKASKRFENGDQIIMELKHFRLVARPDGYVLYTRHEIISIEKQRDIAKQFADSMAELQLKPIHREWKIREASYYRGAIAVLNPNQVPPVWRLCLSSDRSIVQLTLKNS